MFFTDPVVPSNERKHFVEFIPDLLAPLKIKITGGLAPKVFASKEHLNYAGTFLEKNGVKQENFLISVHPGSFYPSQRWPSKYYADLISRISEFNQNAKFLLLGSSAEKELLGGIYKMLKPVAQRNTLVNAENGIGKTIAFISLSKLLIGNNSGLLHIATALAVPTVSFMGPTVPWLWHPYGPASSNIVFSKGLPCSPCNLGECAEHTCMETIVPTEVFETVKALLK